MSTKNNNGAPKNNNGARAPRARKAPVIASIVEAPVIASIVEAPVIASIVEAPPAAPLSVESALLSDALIVAAPETSGAPVASDAPPESAGVVSAPTSAPDAPLTYTRRMTHARGAQLSAKRPGVLALMQSMLEAASAERPVHKNEIMQALIEAFPERDGAQMRRTLDMQIGGGFKIEKRLIVKCVVRATGRHYYIDGAASAELQAQWARAKEAARLALSAGAAK